MAAILILVIITAILEPKFLMIQNITNIMSQLGPLSFFAMGMTFAIVCGFIDLSIVGVINIVAVTTISLIEPLGQVPALFIGLGLGAILGFFNSLLIVSAGAMSLFDALFITFGMSTVYSALALIISGGLTQQMRWITRDTSVFDTIGSGSVGAFPFPIIIFVVCLVLLHIFLSKTYKGRSIMLTGGNMTAARLAGINNKKTVMLVFTLSGLLAAMGSIVMFSRITTASPKLGSGYEMNAILAVVVGGTTLDGGNGGVLRTLFGVILVALLSNCMNLLGVSTHIHSVMSGVIFIAAIWLDKRKENRGTHA
jgi:ribose transport system permease protein